VHPLRPAVDRCPSCGRARCAPDRAAHGPQRCAADPPPVASAGRPPGRLEQLVRAALAGLGAALLGGLVAAQYVDAELFGYLTPAVVGAACGAAAQSASGAPRRGPAGRGVRAVGALAGVLGVALGFLLEGSRAPVSSAAALPFALAVAGALLWTLPPRAARPTAGPAG
jgi:hypothetical protein